MNKPLSKKKIILWTDGSNLQSELSSEYREFEGYEIFKPEDVRSALKDVLEEIYDLKDENGKIDIIKCKKIITKHFGEEVSE